MKKVFVLVVITLTSVLFAATASAACSKDVDCKGDRICENGACVSPAALQPAVVADASTPGTVAPAEPVPAEPVPAAPVAAEPLPVSPPLPIPPPTPATAPAAVPAQAADNASDVPVVRQCVNNMNCMGGEFCSNNVCVPMSQAGIGVGGSTIPQGELSEGWALGGAVAGFIGFAAMTGLAIPSAITSQDGQIPAIPLGAAGTGIFAIMSPIAAAGGMSARRGAQVRGLMGLRIVGWIAYGGAMLDAIVLIAAGAAELDMEFAPLIISTMLVADISLVFFAVDALVSRKQALRKINGTAAVSRNRSVALAPIFAPVISHGRTSGAVFGMGGHF